LTGGDPAAGPVAVLVVAPSAPVRLAAAAALAEAGRRRNRAVHVTESGDGFDALWRFPRGLFDVVVTALSLPTLTGLDLIRLLRARPERGSLVIIAIPGDSADEKAATAVGAICLPMPMDAEALERALLGAGVFGDGRGAGC